LLAKDTNARLVIAYSDTDAGEIGTVYQACNWICVGHGGGPPMWVAPNGRVLNWKIVGDLAKRRGGTATEWAESLRANGWRQQKPNPKYRYVYILDKADKVLAERVESKRTPYPKRSAAAPASGTVTSRAGRIDTDPAAPSSQE
jgi:hypothetical protein